MDPAGGARFLYERAKLKNELLKGKVRGAKGRQVVSHFCPKSLLFTLYKGYAREGCVQRESEFNIQFPEFMEERKRQKDGC